MNRMSLSESDCDLISQAQQRILKMQDEDDEDDDIR
jgi:hypothetical protein